MILTLFYAGATILQSWRLRSITLGIANRIRDQCTISFYRTCTENEDGKFVTMSMLMNENRMSIRYAIVNVQLKRSNLATFID